MKIIQNVIADFKAMPKWKRVLMGIYLLFVAGLVLPGLVMIVTGEISTKVETIEVPDETPPSDGGLVSQAGPTPAAP